VLFNLRYDLRNPPQWRRPFDLYYAQFLEQVEWADGQGFDSVGLSEHHFVEDGYVPSPLVVAAAIAARTRRIRIRTALVLLTLKHPIQVAEDAALVDILSGGRFDLMVGAGYRKYEFAAYGIAREERLGRMAEGVEIIRRCWEEESFDFEGRYWRLNGVRMTPKPIRPGSGGRPRIIMGGNSAAAARLAARVADGFFPSDPHWLPTYRTELIRLGKDPGPPPPAADAPRAPLFLHVSRDPEAAWARIAPHALYETNEYGRYMADDPKRIVTYRQVADAKALRDSGAYTVLTPEDTIAIGKRLEAAFGPSAALSFHPLMGGMPYELGQESLELVVKEVMARFAAQSSGP
jgi:alkanesulfonate monooxygenase SsuD/methylene tetrahydromethanopterin reductase-like flavin-dependent oxidoreductase (luciferase family)